MQKELINNIKSFLSDYDKKEEMDNNDNVDFLEDAIELLNEVIK